MFGVQILCQFSLNVRSKEAERRQFMINTFLAVFSGILALTMAATYACKFEGITVAHKYIEYFSVKVGIHFVRCGNSKSGY